MSSPIRPTTILDLPHLAKQWGLGSLLLASETFQWTGSFKFRAAYAVASGVPQTQLIAASSGNFGQALAYSCALLGKRSIIVMPHNSAEVKVKAVAEYGGQVDLIDTALVSRADRVAALAREHPDAYLASAYDDPLVIQGNATLGRELAALEPVPEVVLVPIGGGGLASGILTGLQEAGRRIEVVGAEPQLANDAARSLQAGQILANVREPQTLADGARTVSVGRHNWPILQAGLSSILEVSEDQIREGVRLLFGAANLKAEPTGALSIGALLSCPERFAGRRVCCVISGGNVDAAVYASLLM
jgi:threonine dehydratase